MGRTILEGESVVTIFGEEHHVKAKVEIVTGLSGHADRHDLLVWAGAIQKKPAQIFMVHGEEE